MCHKHSVTVPELNLVILSPGVVRWRCSDVFSTSTGRPSILYAITILCNTRSSPCSWSSSAFRYIADQQDESLSTCFKHLWKSVVQLLLEKCRRFQLLLEKCRCFQLCCKSVAVFNYGGQSVVGIDQSLQLSLQHHHLLLLVRASIYHLGLLLLLPLQHLLTIAHLQCCSCQVLLLHQHLLQCL